MENKILATVGGMPITDTDVDAFLAELGQRGRAYNTPEGRAMILERLIGNKLLLLDAKRNLFEAEPAFKEQLAKIKDRLLSNYALEKAVGSVRVSDADVRAYFDAHAEEFKGEEVVAASHILVDNEASAKEIYEKISRGELTFEDAAKTYSSCPSKENGGSLGEFTRGQMVPEFDAAVFAMEVGEITKEPVKTQFGYHLIRLDSKTPAKALTFEEVKGALGEKLLVEKQEKAYESKINQLKILYPVDKF